MDSAEQEVIIIIDSVTVSYFFDTNSVLKANVLTINPMWKVVSSKQQNHVNHIRYYRINTDIVTWRMSAFDVIKRSRHVTTVSGAQLDIRAATWPWRNIRCLNSRCCRPTTSPSRERSYGVGASVMVDTCTSSIASPSVTSDAMWRQTWRCRLIDDASIATATSKQLVDSFQL